MPNIRTAWTNNRFTILILTAAIIGLPILAALSAPPASPSTPLADSTPRYSGVKLPPNYRADYVRYATIQRPDGTIRDIYINADALTEMKNSYLIPDDTTIVIDGYNAQKNTNGAYITDNDGHYIRGEPLEMVHVRQKRSDWLPSDFVSEARNGDWNYGSFDIKTGAPYDESITACFNCHHASEQPEFLYSYTQLNGYQVDGETQYFFCDLTGRTAC